MDFALYFTPENIVLGLAVLAGFYMAANIGANDVANAMGTSVGAGTLTLKQALVIAAVFEFCGAFFLGSHVTDTIRKGIVDPVQVSHAVTPLHFALGMLAALIAAGTWLNVASRFGWPVSTTHSIVGAVVGFGVFICGPSVVKWAGLVKIMSSWIISPLSGGLMAFLLFTAINRLILDASDSIKALRFYVPLMAGITISIIVLAIFLGGSMNFMDFTPRESILLALSVGIITFLFTRFRISKRTAEAAPSQIEGIRANYLKIEKNFGYMQILAACYVSFSHGANDVANAIGPLAAIAAIVQQGCVTMKVAVPTWTLFLGAGGIVVGLAVFGSYVMETVGKKITEMSPSRGFAAQFSTATTVLVCSQMGLPISTTHTLVGAVVGVGLARGIAALNLGILRQLVLAWMFEIPITAALTAFVFLILSHLPLW